MKHLFYKDVFLSKMLAGVVYLLLFIDYVLNYLLLLLVLFIAKLSTIVLSPTQCIAS